MIIEGYVAEEIARVEEHIGQLEAMPHRGGDYAEARNERFAEHTLQLAIQRCCKAAVHVASRLCNKMVGEDLPAREAVRELANHGWIEHDLATKVDSLIVIRNLIVHRAPPPRDVVDHMCWMWPALQDAEIEKLVGEVVRGRLGELRDFVKAIRKHLANPKVRGNL